LDYSQTELKKSVRSRWLYIISRSFFFVAFAMLIIIVVLVAINDSASKYDKTVECILTIMFGLIMVAILAATLLMNKIMKHELFSKSFTRTKYLIEQLVLCLAVTLTMICDIIATT
jgi:hypothetical protein